MTAYYNEIDKFAAQMLRNLIAAGHIAPGVVDERSIEDVRPSDLAGFTQCHFFAGVGVWSLALRRAGWPDSRPVWTGSCPCQPFSAAGKGDGFADERHLWPAFLHLISQCEPAAVLGEQVASKDADPWIDLVHTDMEALGYAFGAVPFPSAGVGAPHIRDRLYWVGLADPHDARLEGRGAVRQRADQCAVGAGGVVGGMAHTVPAGRPEGWPVAGVRQAPGGGAPRVVADAQRRPAEFGRLDLGAAARGTESETRQREWIRAESGASGNAGGLANADLSISEQSAGERARPSEAAGPGAHDQPDRRGELAKGQPAGGPTNGLWRDADWLLCRDGKWRPVEPGTFPLAHGAPARVGRLRAYGNSINAEAGEVFIRAVMESIDAY